MRQVSSETVEWFGAACKGGDLTWTALARELYERENWHGRLGAHLQAIFPGPAKQAAAYRLLSNEAVTMEHILDSHFEQTVERCRAEWLVLAVQDT